MSINHQMKSSLITCFNANQSSDEVKFCLYLKKKSDTADLFIEGLDIWYNYFAKHLINNGKENWNIFLQAQ